jgi:hypothetical protein
MYVGLPNFVSMGGGEKRKQPFVKENNLNIFIHPKTPKRF